MLEIPMFRHHVQVDRGTRTPPDPAWKYEHLPARFEPAGGGGIGEARTSDNFFFLHFFYALFKVYTTFQL